MVGNRVAVSRYLVLLLTLGGVFAVARPASGQG